MKLKIYKDISKLIEVGEILEIETDEFNLVDGVGNDYAFDSRVHYLKGNKGLFSLHTSGAALKFEWLVPQEVIVKTITAVEESTYSDLKQLSNVKMSLAACKTNFVHLERLVEYVERKRSFYKVSCLIMGFVCILLIIMLLWIIKH